MLHNRGILFVVAFAVPVLCCLIGIGAFILLNTSMAQDEMPPDRDMAREIKQQEDIARVLKDRLAQIEERIRQLQDELKRKEAHAQLALEIKEIIDSLKSAASGLQKDVPSLYRRLAEIQEAAQEIDVLETEIGNSVHHGQKG